MAAELIDCMRSLATIMEAETEQLRRTARADGLGEIAAAKTRLVGQMEAELARLGRETPNWLDLLQEDTRAALGDAVTLLTEASAANARILERQIDLSVELMNAISAEAQRANGKRQVSYGRTGGLARKELPAPISVNARL